MTAVSYTATHTVVGTLQDGKKMVFSHIIGDLATAGITPVVVRPIKKIDAWWMGVRSPGNTATTFEVVLGSDTAVSSGMNVLYVTAAADTTTSGCELDVISFGV